MDDINEALSLYNELAKKIGLPAAQVLSDTRKRNIRARLSECGGIEGWKAALSNIENSSFLRGNNDRGWKLNLDFLITKNKFISVMEGKYEGEKKETNQEKFKRELYEWTESEGEWSIEDKRKLATVVNEHVEMQKAYGRVINAKVVMRAWQRKFIQRFTVDQIIYAIDKYSDTRDDFPSPANIINILEPQEPLITEAQYVEAQKWQQRNGYPIFSDAKDIIEKYKKQNEDNHESYKAATSEIKKLNGANKNLLTT